MDKRQDASTTVAAAQPEAPAAAAAQPEARAPHLLSTEQLRQRIRPDLSPRSFFNWLFRARADLGFPAGIRVGARRCLWSEAEVAAWIASRPRGGRFDGRRRASGGTPAAGKAA